MIGTRTIQEAGQFAGDAPLTGHHIQGHSINVMLSKGVPEEVLRSSVTHFGTRGLFGKPIRRTSKHDQDNVRRKRWRVAQSSKPKVKPKPSSRFSDDEGRDHQGGSGRNREVPPPLHNAAGSVNTAEKRILHPHSPSIPSFPPNNIKSSSSPPYSTHTRLPTGSALTHQMYSRPEALIGLVSEDARSTSTNSHSHALPLPVTLAGQAWHKLGSSGSHTLPAVAVEKRHMNTPFVALKTPHAESWSTVVDMRDPLPHPPPSQTMNPSSLRMRDSTTMGTVSWTATGQGLHPRHLYVPTTTSGALRGRQWHGPEGKDPESTTGVQGTCGPVRAMRATFYQHSPSPYPSRSYRTAAGHANLSCSPETAESSADAQCTGYGITPSIAATGAHQAQVWQYGRTAIWTREPHDNVQVLSTRTSLSHAHAVHTDPALNTSMTSAALVDSANQHQFSAPTAATATNSQQRSQSACTSTSGYSELAHALVDHHSVALPPTQAVVGAATIPAPLYVPQAQSGAIASPTTRTPGPLAWHAYWQNDLPVAPRSILRCTPAGLVVDATAVSGDMVPILHRPPSRDTMAFLRGTNVMNRQAPHETHFEASTPASRNDPLQEPPTTSTWQGAPSELYDTYQHAMWAHRPA
ncbi:hypothetical protein V8D89_001912 [Ganoderma adspersum]